MVTGALVDLGIEDASAWRAQNLIKLLTTHQNWWRARSDEKPSQTEQKVETGYSLALTTLKSWLGDQETQHFLGVHRYQDVLWYNKEAFEEMLWWMFVVAVIQILAEPDLQSSETIAPGKALSGVANTILACFQTITHLIQAEIDSGYQVDRMLEAVKSF